MTIARFDAFPQPSHVPDTVWRAWLARVRDGTAKPNRESLGAFCRNYHIRGPMATPEPAKLRHYKSANMMGRKAFNEMCARIRAGLADPRFVVGLDAILWDGTRAAAPPS